MKEASRSTGGAEIYGQAAAVEKKRGLVFIARHQPGATRCVLCADPAISFLSAVGEGERRMTAIFDRLTGVYARQGSLYLFFSLGSLFSGVFLRGLGFFFIIREPRETAVATEDPADTEPSPKQFL